ncbi:MULTISPECIES: hypothetical protein [Pseudomonas aeruginosa group]|uniref:hypothetical protein n=1 Tax=Pseudomonas aeruginosa group TaxID=136841 RepID=UPI0008FB5722|nr:hypothetical protein [Pseudomonas aeruginosa]MCW8024568.1 hypothetical protein [Pseudomonas aeruginosa]
MINVSEDFKNWLVSCIGLRLLLALGLFHVFELKKNGAPQAVSLFFDGREGSGTLMCAPDGASIAYSSDAVSECDLGEFGTEKIFSLVNDESFSSVIGEELILVSLIISSVEGSVAGVSLQFGNFQSLILINLGDELFIYKEIPPEIVKCEGLEFVRLS